MEIRLFNKSIYIPLNGLNVSRRLEFSILSRYLNLTGDERVLDVACGDGYWTARIAARTCVIGFDYNRKRLLQAGKSYPAIHGLICSDAHFLPFARGVFDAVVGICVLEHFDDDLAALRELRRVARPGAKLALTVDSFSLPGIRAAEKATHARKYNVQHWYKIADLENALKQAGFEVLEYSYLLKAPLSAGLYRVSQKLPELAYFLFPLSYPISLIGERLTGPGDSGYKLAVSARAL